MFPEKKEADISVATTREGPPGGQMLKLAFTKRQTPQRSRDFLKYHQHTETHLNSHYDDRKMKIKQM